MRFRDVTALAVVVLGTLATIYTAAMLVTGPARARRARHGAHVRVALTGPGTGIATRLNRPESLMPGPAGGRARHRDREAELGN